ncbi:MAG: filamentous hemagglutinin N-terminal domain-containing protein [Calothrix sp. FI2-JRJ7]|jgi:filamentous hemagglutinin family protein|nr:filamentous hemagglutinin N-terminal domain-containing protein [Calothrix sp. FI2-JRJ7]
MKSHVLGFWLAGSNLLSLLSSNPTIAQIAADETLIRNTVVRQQGNVTVIEGGTTAGANLFHSFGSFSVPTGATVHFDNSLDIQHLISRITGKSISNIDGLIRASATGNSFIITERGGLPFSHREALRNNQTATVDWVSIAKESEQSRKVNSNKQKLIIKDLKSKIYNSARTYA